MYTIVLSFSKSVSNFLLICSFILTGSNYYFKETLNFSKKFQSNIKLLSTQDSFPKEVRKFSEDYNNIIRNDFYEIPMIPTELQITSKKILPIVHLS